MIKSNNKWDITSPRELLIGKILKAIAIITFLAIWTPAMVYVTGEVIKLIIK
jgi:hypothetical protein